MLLTSKNTVLLMNIDRNNIEIEITSSNEILLSRISSFGGISLQHSSPERNKYVERLLLETKRSLDIYNKEHKNLPVQKLVLTGSEEVADLTIDIGHFLIIVDTNSNKPYTHCMQKSVPEAQSDYYSPRLRHPDVMFTRRTRYPLSPWARVTF